MLLFLSLYKWRFNFCWKLIILFVVVLLREKSLKSASTNLFFHLKYGILVHPLSSFFFLFWSNILHSWAEETRHNYAVYCKCVDIFALFQMEVFDEFCPVCVVIFLLLPCRSYLILSSFIFKRMWRNQFINIKCNNK